VRNLNHEGWGLPLVQEKYPGDKACDRIQQHNNNRSIRGPKQQQQATAELGHSTGGGGGNLHAL